MLVVEVWTLRVPSAFRLSAGSPDGYADARERGPFAVRLVVVGSG
jgi:hypothetical protein